VPARQCPVIAPEWEDPEGVPIDAILFGGRRAGTVPLVMEAFDWVHGTFIGATAGSETTAAATGAVGQLRRDPMAMLPFCGYNMADYWAHWLSFTGRTDPARLPRVYFVNWFRKDEDGRFLWPGYGENSRVLKWIIERVEGAAEAVDTPIGRLPTRGALDLSGLTLPEHAMDALLDVDPAGWLLEVGLIREHFARFGDKLPPAMTELADQLEARLLAAAEARNRVPAGTRA
jgi:phosphoenolpyruvate carboxykinase (GTP)